MWKQPSQTSFCTVKAKHPSGVTISKMHFWVKGDFKNVKLQTSSSEKMVTNTLAVELELPAALIHVSLHQLLKTKYDIWGWSATWITSDHRQYREISFIYDRESQIILNILWFFKVGWGCFLFFLLPVVLRSNLTPLKSFYIRNMFLLP